jgi:hypothetical protein
MVEKILSLKEIDEIEKANLHGAPTLGLATKALLSRWQSGLRDEETFLRLIFLFWYSRTEPNFLTGLDEAQLEEFTVDTLMSDIGGEAGLSAESRFVIAILGHSAYAFGFGDEAAWQEKSRRFLVEAAEMEPQSPLFGDWRFLIGEAGDSRNLKTKIEREIHARFDGRGSMGGYLAHVLSGMVRPNRRD